VTSQGSPVTRLRRAIRSGDLLLVRSAAAESRVDLEDAFAILLLIAEKETDRYQPAAVRWLGRFCAELGARASLADIDMLRASLAALQSRAPSVLNALDGVLGAHQLRRAQKELGRFANPTSATPGTRGEPTG
jgi:hypothetical protein